MRIIMADNDPRTFSALRILLQCEPNLEVIGEVTNTAKLVELAQGERLDLVLLDWELSGQPDAALLSNLRGLHPEARIIALSGRPESELESLRAGADSFVSKAEPASALLAEMTRLDTADRMSTVSKWSEE
jgi:DNA-binding NarL/FixJ family response regulator